MLYHITNTTTDALVVFLKTKDRGWGHGRACGGPKAAVFCMLKARLLSESKLEILDSKGDVSLFGILASGCPDISGRR